MNIKAFILKIFGVDVELDRLTKVIAATQSELIQLKASFGAQLTSLTDENTALKARITELEKEIGTPNELETYLNNKYPKITTSYTGRFVPNYGMVSIDPRNFFTPFDTTIPTFLGTNDEKALAGLKYVNKKIKYTPDKTAYGLDEFWAFAFETLKTKLADCDDGSILLANIMLNSGIPYYRIRLNIGHVKGGYHAYLTYCRETDDEFVVLDWCYWYNELDIKDRKLHRDERDYYEVDMSWNQKYIFSSAIKDKEGFDMK